MLNGKGEIVDVSLNCQVLNEQIAQVSPYIELESVHVSKLSFHVQSWTNLKKAPIRIEVEDVTAKIIEPLSHVDRSLRRTLKQITPDEYNRSNAGKKPRGPYNFLDRILDNLELAIRSVTITFQPRGRFKTKRVGPWTPPKLVLNMRHVKYCSVNEFGSEASPEECWRHNDNMSSVPASERTLLIYKRMSMDVSFGVQPTSQGLRILLRGAHVEVHIAFHKRFRDGAILDVQADASLNRVELQIDHDVVPELVHFLMGMRYMLGKDRAFDDPLLPSHQERQDEEQEEKEDQAEHGATIVGTKGSDDSDDGDGNGEDDSSESDTEPPAEQDKIADGFLDDNGIPTDSFDEQNTADGDDNKEASSGSIATKPASLSPKAGPSSDRPILQLPSGIVIHHGVSISLSVNDCKVRGSYPEAMDGYIQIIVKGLIAEAIWPKESGEKGGYLQASLSYVSIQECHGPTIRSLLVGGVQHDANPGGVENPTTPKAEIPRDENFPLFEDRCIRRDPLDLRHSFPAQAVGAKATISFDPKVRT